MVNHSFRIFFFKQEITIKSLEYFLLCLIVLLNKSKTKRNLTKWFAKRTKLKKQKVSIEVHWLRIKNYTLPIKH